MAVADFHCMRVGTGELNRLMQEWLFERPYTRKGKTLKIYYATMASVRPPTIVLFVNDPEIVHFSYLRYLENQLRKQVRVHGRSHPLGGARGARGAGEVAPVRYTFL
jgi:GTPase